MNQTGSRPVSANDDDTSHGTVITSHGTVSFDDFTDDDMMNSFDDENTFNPDMTYRFFIAFHVGDDEDLELRGPERVVVKSFTIAMTSDTFERLIYLDDHTNGAWTDMWRWSAWKIGQLGDCTAPALGVFGFDSHEIETEAEQDRVMNAWKHFMQRHGYPTGPIETATHTPDDFEKMGDNPFSGHQG
tara:strand:- start:8352 stop:8912 length:561 start_codon:yes stop_codon:yes gene_type:complete